MICLDLLKELATLAGYSITGTSGADPANKLRALRRINSIKSDVISRFGGRWARNYREGWLALTPLYNTGTVTVSNSSRDVTGDSTVWDSTMVGSKILLGDAYYKIASVTSATSLILTQPYQGTSLIASTYQIWKDEYLLYPEVLSVGGFLDYQLPMVMNEAWPRNMKDSYTKPVNSDIPTVYTVIGNKNGSNYSTGTVSGTINTNTLTGVGTAWLANLEPGAEITIGSYTYHVRSIESDTSLTLYQNLVVAPSSSSYSAKLKNCVIVRFKGPTDQRVVHYWYWAKDYPFVNDNDEDWIAEIYSEVLISGAVNKDYLDKNDVARASLSKQVYEDNIKNAKVSEDNAYVGIRTLGYDVPSSARD